MRKIRQQGDVRFVPCSVPKGKRELVEDGIVAHGEATGHKHRVVGGKVYRIDGELWINATGEVSVVHEEHKTLPLAPGWHKVKRVREWDHFAEEARQVTD